MKICLINNIYKPYDRGGGAERITEIIANELKNKKHDVFIIATAPLDKKNTNEDENNYYLKSFFQHLNKIPKPLRAIYHLFNIFNLQKYFQIKKILQKEKPDLVMSHNILGLGFLIPKLIKKLKIKHIHTLHDIQLLHPSGLMFYGQEKKINTFVAKIYQKINIYLFDSPNVIISPSRWLLDLHTSKNFFKNSQKKAIPNPTPEFKIKEKEKDDNKKIKFLFVGQIEYHKGMPFLVDVFNDLPDYSLTIAGSGDKLELIKKIAKSNIEILGKVPNEKIINLMSKSDCLIVSSLCYENSPTVIYEAIANKLPVIASNIGGIPELAEKYDILLFEPNHKTDLKKQITKIIPNKKTCPDTKQIDFINPQEYLNKILKS